MLNTIYIIQLDNYYDRTVHPYYSEFENGGLGYYLEFDTISFTNFNFVPGDGVNTTVLLNLQEWQFGNYFLVVDENNSIVSRWFITNTTRTRGGQYQLTLRRDVITDYWNIIKQSPALIEKCNLDYDNPLIFNNEDMAVNQIKTKETLLKDKSGCPWLVAYIAKDAAQGLSGTAKVGTDLTSSAIAINDTYENWEAAHTGFLGDYKELNYLIFSQSFDYGEHLSISAATGDGTEKDKQKYQKYNEDSSLSVRARPNNQSGGYKAYKHVLKGFKQALIDEGLATTENLATLFMPGRHTKEEVDEFLELDGKVIRDINGKYFSVAVKETKATSKLYDVPAGSLFNRLKTIAENTVATFNDSTWKPFSGQPNTSTFKLNAVFNTYDVVLTPLVNMDISYSISNTRISTEDASYDILAIPYGRIYAGYGGTSAIETSAEIGLGVIQAIAKNLDAACYDIQLVPYCPMQDYMVQRKTIITNNTGGSDLASFIMQGETKVGVIYHVPKANFTFNLIDYEIKCADTAIERKINNDCDKWRLCSPNYSNYFDFSVEKNNGVDYFNVDCTYKPYSPYIHINPNFNGLYGQDFNDPRGLVLGGDFSLGQVRGAWESYQLQNKNFQETFDRQIQNMEFNNKYARAHDIVGASLGTVSGGLAGATTGLVATGGNPIGAAVGGGIGGVSSLGGGIADIFINEALRNETLDYTKDLFGYNLGNIKAIPLTLSKVSAFNENNKVFPVLEYYTCTDTEKIAYANKIAYNGMTTMVIDTIENNISTDWEYEINEITIKSQNYIKARIIRTSLDNEGFQIANAIADEVNKGFYIVEE